MLFICVAALPKAIDWKISNKHHQPFLLSFVLKAIFYSMENIVHWVINILSPI